MNDKQTILATLRDEMQRWEDLLAGMSEAQITAPQLPAHWSIKDVVAHLWAWQRRSIARLQAGLLNQEPEFPAWPGGLDSASEENTTRINAALYETYRDKPWSRVHQDWRDGYNRFVELGASIPDTDLLAPGRYPFMGEYPLAVVLTSSYEHHAEHLDILQDWLRLHKQNP